MYLFSHQKKLLAMAKLVRAKELVFFVLLLNCQTVIAQSNNDAVTEKILPPPYQSALDGYQSYQEQSVSSWREANDEVGKIGGWRVYAREASNSDADQFEVKDKTDALPANKTQQHHGGSHE